MIPFSALPESLEDDDLALWATIPDPAPLPEEVAEQHDVQAIIQHAINTLPPKYRAIVLLRYIAQLTFAEIGEVLHMSTATTKTYFQRSKPLLRVALAEQVGPRAPHPSLLPGERQMMQEEV